MDLGTLIEGLPIALRGDAAGAGVRICDVTDDSRTVVPGSLFIARAGVSDDGRRYIAGAVEAGAAAVLTDDEGSLAGLPAGVAGLEPAPGSPGLRELTARLAERWFGAPSSRLIVAGVTGTNGKTTVAHLVHRLCNACGVRCGLIGTVEIDDGSERSPAGMTTPAALELARTMSVMVESGCRAVVSEVSSHALDQARVDAVRFDVAAFTNLTGDHLDYHGDMDAYASAKRRLFELLAADPGGGLAVVNLDDPRGRWMAGPAGRVAGCSMSAADAAWNVRTLWAGGGGSRLVIDRIDHEGPAQLEATVELIGAHNAMNVLQSVVIADEIVRRAGVEEPEARRRMLERAMSLLTAPAGRLERVSTPSDDVVGFVDYAHTDDALEKAASALRSVMRAGSSLWLVFGCGGERDTGKRPRMGHVAARLADKIVVTSDNPRSEPPASIVRDILEGVPGPVRRGSRVHVHVDRAEAIGVAARLAAPGDVILVAGKGHETEQVIGEEVGGVTTLRTLPFDDREQLREALRARREGTRGRSAARA